MPKGPNRKIVTDGMFLLQQGAPKHLGKIGGVDFSNLSGAEAEILYDWYWYNSLLQAEQDAPDRRKLEATIEALVAALEIALTATKAFQNVTGGWRARHEFSAAINDLLREAELEPTYFKESMQEASRVLDRMATIARVIRAALAGRLENEEPHISSTPAIRDDFYRRLHQTLARHKLDTGVGRNGLMVELVLYLQGKTSDYADPIERRRKDLAREIKLAVKPRKGG
jgi:hypothetical protein